MKTAQLNKLNKTIGVVNTLFATKGDKSGEIDLQWDANISALSYVIQMKLENNKNSNWKHIDIISDSKYTVSGLKPKFQYAFRIAIISKNGQGPWSEAFKKTIQ